MDYIIKLDEFEGPMDLLLELIRKHEMDIYDLQISKITKDYLITIDNMKENDIDVTSDFIELASTLLQVKAKLLIPVEVEKEDPREELVQQILDYKEYKKAVEKMQELKDIENKFFKREKDIKIRKKKKGTIQDLINSYQAMMKKKFERKPNPLDMLTNELTRFNYTIEGQMDFIKHNLEIGKINIIDFFNDLDEKEEAITTFSALLELVKTQYITILINEEDCVFIEKKSNSLLSDGGALKDDWKFS